MEEHCRDVAVEAGAHVAAAVRSWFPPVEIGFIKDGAHPNTTDDQWNNLLETSMEPVAGLLSDLSVNPGHLPLAEELRRPGLSPNAEEDEEASPADDSTDLAPQA